MRECGLELHPDKTKVVYCRDIHRREEHESIQFDFLGYTFRPRRSKDRYGRVFVNFTPALSRVAAKAMRQTVRGWRLQLKSDKSIEDLARMFGPIIPRMDELLLPVSSVSVSSRRRPPESVVGTVGYAEV